MARQRLGQHFLGDAGWREKIARAIRISPHSVGAELQKSPVNSCWIEIGSGHGEMTELLVRSGQPVIAVELDPPLIAGLQKLSQQHPNLSVSPGDVLQTDLAALAAGRRMRLYGNLPYYITSPILHHFFQYADQIDEIHIVIQTEVALRLVAEPGTRDYGYLSVLTQFYSRPILALDIPRNAFVPPPEVESALVTLRFPGERAKLQLPDEHAFLEFVKLCFAQKRKTISNNLRSLAKPDVVRSALEGLAIRPDARAEQLSVAKLAALHAALTNKPTSS